MMRLYYLLVFFIIFCTACSQVNKPCLENTFPNCNQNYDLLLSQDFHFEDIHYINPQQQNIIHVAAQKGWADIILLGIKSNVDLNALDYKQNTPLLLAVKNKHPMAVETLLIKGANVAFLDPLGFSVLDIAVMNNLADCVEILLSKRYFDLNHSILPLAHIAVMQKQTNILQSLMKAHINMNQRLTNFTNWPENIKLPIIINSEENLKKEGLTPLQLAIMNNDIHTATIIMEEKPSTINMRTLTNKTILHLAVIMNNIDLVKLILSKSSALINTMDNEGKTPLAQAKKNNNLKLVQYLKTFHRSH